MSNMFGGGSQGQFGGQAFSAQAMNPLAPAMQVQEVGVAPGELVYTSSLGARSRDRNGRRLPYMPGVWPWGGQQSGPKQGRY